MNNILAAKVLMLHLNDTKDGAYRIATEIAIECLLNDAVEDWHKLKDTNLTITEYLGLSSEEYFYWLGKDKVKREADTYNFLMNK